MSFIVFESNSSQKSCLSWHFRTHIYLRVISENISLVEQNSNNYARTIMAINLFQSDTQSRNRNANWNPKSEMKDDKEWNQSKRIRKFENITKKCSYCSTLLFAVHFHHKHRIYFHQLAYFHTFVVCYSCRNCLYLIVRSSQSHQ